MKPEFSTYTLKKRAKKAMQGKLFKAFAAAVLPVLITLAVAMLVVMLVPDAREAFELTISGKFDTAEARMLYLDSIINICTDSVSMLTAVFAFLFIGAQRVFLDMLRGKDVKIRNVFQYFSKWYVAFVYPAVTVAVTYGIRALLDMLLSSGMNAEAVTAIAWVLQIAIYFVALKLMFVELILADNNCTGVVNAIKTSWKMVNMGTMVNMLVLALSFIGWFAAGVITGGLAFVYLMPYMSLTIAAYYECIIHNA